MSNNESPKNNNGKPMVSYPQPRQGKQDDTRKHYRDVEDQMQPFPDDLPRAYEAELTMELPVPFDLLNSRGLADMRLRDNITVLKQFVAGAAQHFGYRGPLKMTQPDVALYGGLKQCESLLDQAQKMMKHGVSPVDIFPISFKIPLGYLASCDVNAGLHDIQAIRARVDEILKRPAPAGVPSDARQGIGYFKEAIRKSWLPQLEEMEQRELELYEALEDQLPRDTRDVDSWLEAVRASSAAKPGPKR